MTSDDHFRAALKKISGRKAQGGTGISDLIINWTDDELLAALEEALQDPEALLDFNSMASMLFREFANRNPDRAVEWIKTLPTFQQKDFAGRLVSVWPKERSLEALEFVKNNPGFFGEQIPMELVTRCISLTSAQGPDAVLSMLEQLSIEGFPRNHGFPIEFPPGFDYGALLSSERFESLQLPLIRNSVIRNWAKVDRDATFQWLADTQRGSGMISILMPPWETSPERTRWFLGKIGGLGAEKQKEFFDESRWQIASPSFNLRGWMDAAPSGMKQRLLTTASQALFLPVERPVENMSRALETLPDVEERLRMLETLPRPTNLKMEIRPLADAEVDALRKKLTGWGADPARTESIVTRYKNPPQP